MIRCYAESVGQGRDLVLLHGWGMNNGVWQPLLDSLTAHYRVTMIELPGHGASDASVSCEDWSQACLEVAPQSAVWLGWSLGAQVAIQAALQAPQRVLGLFLVGATPKFVANDGWFNAMPEKTFGLFSAALAQDANATLTRFLSLQVQGAENARETVKQLKSAIANRPAASTGGLDHGLQLLLDNDLRRCLDDLQVSSAWVFGEKDTLLPVAAAKDIAVLSSRINHHIIAGAGHAPFLSHVAECFALLQEYMNTSELTNA